MKLYILFGGYPKVVLAGAREEKLEELKELYAAYELKDVNILFNMGLKAFKKIYPDFEQIVVTFDRFSRYDDITYVPGWMI